MEDPEVKNDLKRITTVMFPFIIIFMSSLISGGCAATMNRLDQTVNTIKELQQKFVRSIREPGEKMVVSPEKTSENHSCHPGRTTFILELTEVIPNTVSPGEEIDQRIRYAMCPHTPSDKLRGQIIRTVLYKGVSMFKDVTDYEFKPGSWTVDAFIQVPDDARSGVYLLEVVVKYSQTTTRRTNEFVVQR